MVYPVKGLTWSGLTSGKFLFANSPPPDLCYTNNPRTTVRFRDWDGDYTGLLSNYQLPTYVNFLEFFHKLCQRRFRRTRDVTQCLNCIGYISVYKMPSFEKKRPDPTHCSRFHRSQTSNRTRKTHLCGRTHLWILKSSRLDVDHDPCESRPSLGHWRRNCGSTTTVKKGTIEKKTMVLDPLCLLFPFWTTRTSSKSPKFTLTLPHEYKCFNGRSRQDPVTHYGQSWASVLLYSRRRAGVTRPFPIGSYSCRDLSPSERLGFSREAFILLLRRQVPYFTLFTGVVSLKCLSCQSCRIPASFVRSHTLLIVVRGRCGGPDSVCERNK